MIKHLLTSLSLIVGLNLVYSQDQVQLTLPDLTTTTGATICLPIISSDSFPDIASAQFSLGWDTTIVSYSHIEPGENPLGITASNTFSPNANVLNFSWFTPNGQGISLPPETILFEVCYIAGDQTGSTDVVFGAGLPAEFIQEGIFVAFPNALFNGSITILETEQLSVLPGDTNQDSLVNADDILNIGLGFGANGSPRIDAQTDFNFQTTNAWLNSTPISMVDYAHLDTDGNGSINVDDALVVETNFGESMLNFAPNVEDISRNGNMPFIFAANDPIQGGSIASIPIYLGNDANPVNPGYGLAFSIQFSPTQFDLSTIEVDFNGSFLGEDLLTFSDLFPNEIGLLEIAGVRKDQVNSTNAGGLVCTINIQPLALANNQTASLFITPYRYIDASETATALAQSISEVLILAPSNTLEPIWAKSLSVSPNPSDDGQIAINGLANEVANIEIIDAQGQLLHRYFASNRQLDLSHLPRGIYYLRFVAGNQVATRRIIIGQ